MRHSRLSTTALAAFTFSLANPAFAQDVCGGLGAGGQWIGGSEGASDISTATSVQEQMALVLGGNEYVALFSVSGQTDVRIEAQGRGAADPQLDVYDSTGSVVTSDDDSGGGGAARAEVTLDAGNYCVAVRSYDGAPMTSFVRVTRSDQEALTAGVAAEDPTPSNDTDVPALLSNNSCADAQPLTGELASGLTGTRTVNEGGYWSFTSDGSTPLTLRAENQDADPVLSVYDANNTLVAENDDFDGLNSQIDFDVPLAAGDYCIQVTAIDDNDLPITTSITAYDPSAVLHGQVNNGDVAPPLDGSFPVTDLGVVERRTLQDIAGSPDVQWFSVEMAAAGLLLVEAVSPDGSIDPWLVAFDDLGRKIGQNDDYGDSLDSLMAARVPAGTYVIGVKQLEEEGSGPIRMVVERYVAAQ